MSPDDYDPIASALKEDIGNGDITTEFFVPEALHASGRIVAHEPAVIAGTKTAAGVFRKVDPATDVQIVRLDGEPVVPGDLVIEVRGLARSILKAERVALNFLQRLCGIATLTRQFVDAVGNHPAKILDTRKTTPGLRVLEKAAVVAGHSLGEYSALAAAGSFSIADAAQLLKLRGQSMQRAVPAGEGAMAALLGADMTRAEEICAEAAPVPEAQPPETEVIQLANGCICCTINGDLLAATQRVLGFDPPVERAFQSRPGVEQHVHHHRRSAQMGDMLALDRLVNRCGLDPAQTDMRSGERRDRPRKAPPVAVKHRQRP